MTAIPKDQLDWGQLSQLRIESRLLVEGLFSGTHRSVRRGSGVEFEGHRDYYPGDDLRRLDTRALMRHGRLLVREFETETERCVCLLMDATASMAYRGPDAPAAKLAFASLLAAAVARITVSAGDRVSLDWVGGQAPYSVPGKGGRDAFERVAVALEAAAPGGDAALDLDQLGRNLVPVARRAGRGSLILFFTDLVDLPPGAKERISALSNDRRHVVVVQVLAPAEANFPFRGALRLEPSAGGQIVETDARAARPGYLRALAELQASWAEALLERQGRLVSCTTAEPPLDVLRRILISADGRIEGAHR